MGEDEFDVVIFVRGAAEDEAGYGARGVGAVFDCRILHFRDQIDAAICGAGMGVDDGAAPVQLVHDRREGWIAEPFVAIAGEQRHPVGFERVEAVGDFGEAAVDIGQRQHRENAEPAWEIRGQLGGVVVAFSSEFAAERFVGEGEAWGRYGGDRGRDAGFVHVFDGAGWGPVAGWGLDEFCSVISVT